MSVRSELRAAALERDGHRCRFPDCDLGRYGLEMAHLQGLRMGGSKHGDEIDNVIMLCKHHHDWLDGRTTVQRRLDNELVLRAATGVGVERRRPR